MIQTWVTYEVVKVIFLYGLNPELNTTIKDVAPQIQAYIQYIKNQEESKYNTAETVHKTLLKETLHSSYFGRYKFADTDKIVWKDDVKVTIPIIILTWLRQLQQGFDDQKTTIYWSTLGNYTPIEHIPRGAGVNQLGLVYLSKPTIPESLEKVKSYTDIRPDETYDKVTETNYTIKSLEMWAMMLLQPPVEKNLNDTAREDKETRMRQKICTQLKKNNYQFIITSTNFAPNTSTAKKNKPEDQRQPTTNTTSKKDDDTNHAHNLHSAIINDLSKMEQQLTNLNHQTNTTKNTTKLATLLKSIQTNYHTLANITFQGETEGNTLFDTISSKGSDDGNYEENVGEEEGKQDDEEEKTQDKRNKKKKKNKKKKDKKGKTSKKDKKKG
jgi:hypothetical protein